MLLELQTEFPATLRLAGLDYVQQVAALAGEVLKALPDSMRESLHVLTCSKAVAELAARQFPKQHFVTTSVRRLPTTAKYVLLLDLTRSQVGWLAEVGLGYRPFQCTMRGLRSVCCSVTQLRLEGTSAL